MTTAFPAFTDLSGPEAAGRLVRAFGTALGADRCFLYLRDPATDRGRVVACWRRSDDTPDLPEHDYYPWQDEDRFLHDGDPMFTAALAGQPAIFVDDIEDAGGLVDVAFERGFRHRALVHLNLNAEGPLWGILQPAMSAAPRAWSDIDRALCLEARARLTPLASAAVRRGWPAGPAPRLTGADGAPR